MILLFERPGRLMELCSRLQQQLYITTVTVERAQTSDGRIGRIVAQTNVCATLIRIERWGRGGSEVRFEVSQCLLSTAHRRRSDFNLS